MNFSRSLFCSVTMALLSYLMVSPLYADGSGSGDPPSSLVNYEFCTVSQLKTDSGYSAVLVNLLDSSYRGSNGTNAQTSGLVYKGYIGRISPTHFVCPAPVPASSANLTDSSPGYTKCNRESRCPGHNSDGPCLDGDWVIVDRSLTRWCRANQCGSLTDRERESLTVLCNTPDIVHSFVPVKDISRLPAYNVSQGEFHPRAARLCSVPWNIPKPNDKTVTRNLTGVYFPAGPLADPRAGDGLSAAEICWPFYVDDGLHFFDWQDVEDDGLRVTSEASFLIAQKRDRSESEDPVCKPSVVNHVVNQWEQPRSTLGTIFVDDVNPETLKAPQSSQSNYTPPEGALPASQVNVLTEYPRAEINYCELVSANQKERFAGIEFPEIKIAIATTGAKPVIKSSPAGCKLMQPEGNQYEVVPVAFTDKSSPSDPDDAQRGYERMTVPTTYGWVSSASYTDQNRAGCIARELSANPYNLCRFDDPSLTERKLYGILEDGSDTCQAIALTYDESLDFKYIIKTASTFEVFDFTAEPPPPTEAITEAITKAPDSALFQSAASISVYMVTVILTLANML